MRKKRWLTAGMAVIAAAAVIMAATSYNEIRKKLNMQCENQKTMLVAGYELQTENTEKDLMQLIRLKVLQMIRMNVLFCLARFRFRVTTARMNRALIH